MEESSKSNESSVDVTETIAFRLLDEAFKLGQINEAELEFLKSRYKKLHQVAANLKSQEHHFSKRIKNIESDILEEKINIEKLHINEVEETRHLHNTGEVRASLQQQLEFIEQKDTIAKFELFELKKLHEELTNSLNSMILENNQLVDPVFENLKKEILDLNEQLIQTEANYERQDTQKTNLLHNLAEQEEILKEKEISLKQKLDNMHFIESEPGRLERQTCSIEGAKAEMENDHRSLQRKMKAYEADQELQAKKRSEAEKLRTSILQKLELNRQTLEERELDLAAINASLEKAKAIGHDLVTRKVELNIKKREIDNNTRHLNDQLILSNKEFDLLKRQLKKKRMNSDSARQSIPIMEENVSEQEAMLRNLIDERNNRAKDILKQKDEVDIHVARLLQQEGIESEKKKELEKTISDLDELEASLIQLAAEGKRQSKLLAVLSAQRDIKARDCTRISTKERESKHQVRIKELVILDLTKRCNEISNRLKEFSALYEVVKNERNKYVNLIQSTAQALAEMREKIRILHNEVEILGNERTAKIIALNKEINSHQQAINQRDSLRQDLNRLLSEYRAKQGTVEQQIQEIDKLNIVINNLEKDMLQLKSKYERAVEDRNLTGVQLIDRNDELCILYERSNQQQEALRRGETESIKKEEELRLLRLQKEELKRQYSAAARRLPEMEADQVRIKTLEVELEKEIKSVDELSSKLEDPQNLDRWRPLEGNDLDVEQLAAKIQVLEDRLDKKREQLLEKELVLEEISSLTEKLRSQAVTKRDAAKILADQLNDLHGRIRDVTKKMLASVSELSMYQATALRLQQEKMFREKTLEEATWRFDHGEAPSEEAVKELSRSDRQRVMAMEVALHRQEEMQMELPGNMLKTAAEPRPTAYIPDDLGIPRPYGNLAPFKPSEVGSTMRHIRAPVIKPIEI